MPERTSNIEQQELFLGEEKLRDRDPVSLVPSDDPDLHVYKDSRDRELYIVHRSGFLGSYQWGALGVKAPHGHNRKEDTVGSVAEVRLMPYLLKEVYSRLTETQKEGVIMEVWNDDGYGEKRLRLFKHYFELEPIPDQPWFYRIKGLIEKSKESEQL